MTRTLTSGLPRAISDEEIQAYERDGAAVIRNVLPEDWVELMRDAIERILESPGPASREYTPEGKRGRYYGDFFIWWRDPVFKAFMKDSPLPELAARVMHSGALKFFYDQLLVKEPNTEEPTPWHQDLSYWPVRGNQILSVWVPFDRADEESGVVVYVKGSHKWGKLYAPHVFSKDSDFGKIYEKAGLEPLPDIEAERDQHEILSWTLEPGDVLIHHPLTLHYASGNRSKTGRRRGLALRYLGDDAVFDARPGTFMENRSILETLPQIELKDGEPFSGEVFPPVWPREN
ncbi:phytanoyl-CoA dioxygenase family protein [Emcibacter nanhaiensis]|uniref:Phytanoyl-CoA dioxygenase family protein n=1 Tax=Emcibacter nanhaiensis TaxID=1505037 RepID=A0A501PJK5_9PROT|nr:phytanoyl-CoA dioxygenase family protein [Emcibacter nanhaiensis]TPD60649.1 phytanoyl-CoA dioxygenase family protein [Emcibacter nanhaiensis]